MISLIAVLTVLVIPCVSSAKVLPPIGIEAKLLNDPESEGVAIIEVKASSQVTGEFKIKCEYGKLTLLEGPCPASFTLGEGGSKTFTYRFNISKPPQSPSEGGPWPPPVRFMLKTKGFIQKTSVEIGATGGATGALPLKPKGNKGRGSTTPPGVREFGP